MGLLILHSHSQALMPALLNAVNALLRLGLPAKAACCLVLAPQDSESPAGVQQASPCAALAVVPQPCV